MLCWYVVPKVNVRAQAVFCRISASPSLSRDYDSSKCLKSPLKARDI